MENQFNQQELIKAIRNGDILPERSREYWREEERAELVSLY